MVELVESFCCMSKRIDVGFLVFVEMLFIVFLLECLKVEI